MSDDSEPAGVASPTRATPVPRAQRARVVRIAATLHAADRPGTVRELVWGISVQTARPRDVGALLFVIGLFLSLFVVTLLVPGH